jgi:hypothetical protein
LENREKLRVALKTKTKVNNARTTWLEETAEATIIFVKEQCRTYNKQVKYERLTLYDLADLLANVTYRLNLPKTIKTTKDTDDELD